MNLPNPQKFLMINALAVLLSACATQPPAEAPQQAEHVWPVPPSQPVIRYLREYSKIEALDIEKKPSFVEVLTGEEKSKKAETLEKPYGVAVDVQGRLFVADTMMGLFVFDQANGAVERWGEAGPGKLTKPIAVAVGQAGQVFVTDAEDKRVVVFDRDGGYLTAFGGQEVFANPAGIAVNDRLGRIYVADSKAHRIMAFDMQGEELLAVGEKGFGEGQFMFPAHLTIAPDDRVFVSDSFNFRVQILDKDLNYLKSFGQVGQRMGDLNRPKGIALDSDGHVYVLDASFNNFQIFTEEGQLLLFVGDMGSSPGQFVLPMGMHIDDRDRIYIADQLNKRVQVFQYLGEPDVVETEGAEDIEKSDELE